jgi:hypothetical protein
VFVKTFVPLLEFEIEANSIATLPEGAGGGEVFLSSRTEDVGASVNSSDAQLESDDDATTSVLPGIRSLVATTSLAEAEIETGVALEQTLLRRGGGDEVGPVASLFGCGSAIGSLSGDGLLEGLSDGHSSISFRVDGSVAYSFHAETTAGGDDGSAAVRLRSLATEGPPLDVCVFSGEFSPLGCSANSTVDATGTLSPGTYSLDLGVDAHTDLELGEEPTSFATAGATLLLGDLAGGSAIDCDL